MSSTGVVDNCLKIPVPVLNLHMMSNEEELELIEECKRKHPERYTPECLAKAQKFAELPCNIPGLR